MSEWRPIPGFSRYTASPAGEVRGRYRRLLRQHVSNGYLSIKLWSDDDRRVHLGTHQIVAMTFIGPRPSSAHQVAHCDGVKTNNTVDNLRWATPAENTADKVIHGTHQAGEQHPQRRLTAAQVAAIRSRWVPNTSGLAAALAADFGVSAKTISKIAAGERWKA